MKKLKSILLFIITGCICQAQTITINGRAIDDTTGGTLYKVIIINQRTSEGTIAQDGKFSMLAYKTDTILISASGFSIKKLCFHDSALKEVYNVVIRLYSLSSTLQEVHIYSTHSFNEIHNEEKELGNIRNTDTYKSVSIMNPITLLYERFSKLENSKRKVAKLEDEEKKREILKDLFHLFIKYDIIDLSDNKFDAFIDYLNLSDSFIKNSTDYELLMTIKSKYEIFQTLNTLTPH